MPNNSLRLRRRLLGTTKQVGVPPKHGAAGFPPHDALNKLYHAENFQFENTEVAHQFDPETRTSIEEVLAKTEGQEYLRLQDAVAQNVLAHVTATMPHRHDFELMLAELQHMRLLLKTQLDDVYKRRVWQDEWVAMATLVEYTLDYHERTYLFMYSPVAITLSSNDGGTIAINSGWNNISFRRGLKLVMLSPTTPDNQPIWVLVRACDELMAAFMSIPGGVTLNAGSANIGNVGQQNPLPTGATPKNQSNVGTNAAVTATVTAGGAGRFTWITGFEITAVDTATGGTGRATVTGVGTTLNYEYSVQGTANGYNPLIVPFNPPIRSGLVNTDIVVSVPALGAGTGEVAVTAHGYNL
jgi:hypothetical protein